ncbi:unnamed protein product [Caretta caretta]
MILESAAEKQRRQINLERKHSNPEEIKVLTDSVALAIKMNSLVLSVQDINDHMENSIITFINILCAHLADGFPEDEVQEWFTFGCAAIVKCDFSFGIHQVKSLCSKYKDFRAEEIVIISQYNDFKFAVAERIKSHLVLSFLDMVTFAHQNEQCQDLAKLMDIGGTFLASSADCERGFSLMNLLKNKLWNRLQVDPLDMLMCIKSNQLDGGLIDLDRVYIEWAMEKDRREKQHQAKGLFVTQGTVRPNQRGRGKAKEDQISEMTHRTEKLFTALEPVLQSTSIRVREALASFIRTMGAHGLLEKSASRPLIDFSVRQCTLTLDSTVRKKQDQILGSFVLAVCECCDPRAIRDAIEGLCWMLRDPKTPRKAHVTVPLVLQVRTFFEDENSGLRRASMELFGHLRKLVSKKSSLFRAEVEKSMGTLLIHLQDGTPSCQPLRMLVQSQLAEGAAPAIPAFLSEACRTLDTDLVIRLLITVGQVAPDTSDDPAQPDMVRDEE